MDLVYVVAPVECSIMDKVFSFLEPELRRGVPVYFLLSSVNLVDEYKKFLARRDILYRPGQVFIGTILHLANRILDDLREPYRNFSRVDERLLVYSYLLRKYCDEDSKSGVWGSRVLSKAGALQKALQELYEMGVPIEELLRYVRGTVYEPVIYELSEIARDEEKIADRERRVTHIGRILKATGLVEKWVQSLEQPILVIDGFYELTRLQEKFLRNLIANFDKTFVRVFDGKQKVYSYCQLKEGYFGSGKVVCVGKSKLDSKGILAIRDNLFSSNNVAGIIEEGIFNPYRFTWDNVKLKLVKCFDRHAEVEVAARTIKEWIRLGLEPERIGVVYRGGYDYSYLINFVFRKFGIPISGNGVVAPMTGEVFQFVKRLAELNLSGFERGHLIDMLRLKRVEEFFGREVIQKFEIISTSWGVPGGVKSWLVRCIKRREFLEFLKDNADDEVEKSTEVIEEEIRELKNIWQFLTRLFRWFILPSVASLGLYLSRIVRAVRDIYGEKEGKEVISFLEDLRYVLDKTERKVDLFFFYRILSDLLSEMESKSDSRCGVFVSDAMNARGKVFSGLVILGLCDGEFPAFPSTGSVLTDEAKIVMNEGMGEKLFSVKPGVDIKRERFLFYYLMSMVRERLLITFSEEDLLGRVLGPSVFVAELVNAVSLANSRECSFEEFVFPPRPGGEIGVDCIEDLLCIADNGEPFDEELRSALKDVLRRANLEAARVRGDFDHGEVSKEEKFNRRRILQFFEKNISISRLQEYRKCPFFFLCKNIWQIDVIEEPDVDVDRLTVGSLVHKLFEEFTKWYIQMKKGGEVKSWDEFLSMRREELENVSLSHRLLERYYEQLSFLPEPLLERNFNFLDLWLRKFIEFELALLKKLNFEPLFAEESIVDKVNFGASDYKLPDARFKCRVDRVDRSNDTNGVYIVEYKLSLGSVVNPVRGLEDGVAFQIPFYILMLKRRFSSQGDIVKGGVFYAVKDGRRSGQFSQIRLMDGRGICEKERFEKYLDSTRDLIKRTLEDIFRGYFPVRPVESDKCRECAYFDVCHFYGAV